MGEKEGDREPGRGGRRELGREAFLASRSRSFLRDGSFGVVVVDFASAETGELPICADSRCKFEVSNEQERSWFRPIRTSPLPSLRVCLVLLSSHRSLSLSRSIPSLKDRGKS